MSGSYPASHAASGAAASAAASAASRWLTVRIGWRNLGRNRRRTWLTAAGVAFAVLLVVTAMCIQLGGYQTMEENATSLVVGHLQVHNAAYVDNDRLENKIADASAILREVAKVDSVVAVAPRVETFALASAGERSFGARIMGIDPSAEAQVVRLEERIIEGRGVTDGNDGLVGEGLARNLGVGVGDEIVVLGTAMEGGVAAMAIDVVGLFRSGQSELDRAVIWAPLAAVQNAFGLGDEVHTLVVRSEDLGSVDATAAQVAAALRGWPSRDVSLSVRPWHEVLPDLRQAIAVDRISAAFFYWIIMILVAFSVVNTFIMTVFERTREFGVLLAIGMRPGRIVRMLQWEAFFVWLLGTAIGLGLALLLVSWLKQVGIYLGEDMERLAEQIYMPTRMYPAFVPEALLTAPLVMLLGTQLAALIPSWRVRRLVPSQALRGSG